MRALDNLKSFINYAVSALLIAVFLGSSLAPALRASAAVNQPSPSAQISFTFDDGLTSALTTAAPTLAKYGLTGTNYVITDCVGMTTAPNSCHANTDKKYMSWSQIASLSNTYGWEIGSHSQSHPYLATYDATDGQPAPLSDQQVVSELANSKATLAAHGIDAVDFSTPYGDYNNYTLREVAKYYQSHRGFADQNNNDWPFNEYLLNDYQVQGRVSVATVKAKIDDAIANKRWLILTMHDILARASNKNDDYEYSTSKLDQIAAYVKAKQDSGLIKSVNVRDGYTKGSQNLLANGDFSAGISEGWRTDDSSVFSADAGFNGSYPEATHSIRFASAANTAHLFSPMVPVTSGQRYLLKNFLDEQTNATGEVAFYVDEYDANGDWVSGQYLKGEPSSFVENLNMLYTPSTIRVSQASLQVIVTGNSGITGYLDSAQWLALDADDSTPPVVQPASLLPNSSFDNGLTDWSTDDPTHIVADSSNNGSPNNPQNAVKLTSGTTAANGHLFSAKLGLTPGSSYTINSYLDIRSMSGGEIAFYIDEYDANGNWISGQYKIGVHTTGAKNVGFAYTPSSSSVDAASLQVIVVGNSNITAYLDDVRWLFAN